MLASDRLTDELNIQDSGIKKEAARMLQKALPYAEVVWGVPPMPLR